MTYTPGPWTWDDEMLWNDPADTVVLNHAGTAWKVTEENKRLIAAAPDLLAALKEVTREAVALANSGDCGSWDPEQQPDIIMARKAIAKAEAE